MYNIETDTAVTGVEAIICESQLGYNYRNYAYHNIYPN